MEKVSSVGSYGDHKAGKRNCFIKEEESGNQSGNCRKEDEEMKMDERCNSRR